MAADGSIRILTKLDNTGINKGLSQLTGGLKKFAGMVGVAFSVAGAVAFGKASVQAANELSNALTGLKSIADGQGKSFSQAQKFIDDYTKDGLIPATNAVTAYKNLIARGYNTEQIEQTLTNLKDAATFGRQASYSLGDAVTSATEGLKNENSILVDNAGVTKNVAKMWDEYAKSIGTTANNLTQQQKIQAEVNGIMQETKWQVGDAQKLTGTFSGQLSQISASFNNLKVALGNAIIPIARAILPYINAIVTGLTTIANKLAVLSQGIFGKVTAADMQSQASAVNSIADAADNSATSIENTEKAAKKAKKMLAGFDELNVMSSKDEVDSSSGATGTVASVGSAPAIIDIPTPKIGEIDTSSMAGVVEKIKGYLKPLSNINFDNLKNAFNGLKESISPLGKAIFDGLDWAYHNLLVPLAEWTVEDVAPAFLKLLSGAADVLSAAIDALKPLAMWLWDNFLQPIAEWTGGVIVSSLENTGKALSAIGDWIRDNESTVQNIAIVIGSFAAAWGLVNLAIGTWNVIGVIATGITTAFGAAVAFLTSPITLVVLAIGAIIAIVVLLIKYWDEISDFAVKVWNGIVSVFKNVVTSIGNFFAGLWDGIKNTFSAVGSWFKDIFSSAWNGIKTAWSGVKSWFGGVWDGIKNVFSSVGDWFSNIFQSAWNGIKNVWSKVGNFFSDLWNGIKDTTKTIFDKIVDVVKAPINFIIDAINKLINGLNKVSFDVPDWVPAIGGKKLGFNIPKIPRLAQGAVIPPNREFLAVLGDQKSGTNIETPLATMIEAFNKALDSRGNSESGNFHITLMIDGKEFSAWIADIQRKQSFLSNGRAY